MLVFYRGWIVHIDGEMRPVHPNGDEVCRPGAPFLCIVDGRIGELKGLGMGFRGLS